MNSLHGDADLYVSRKDKYPNRASDFEKKSEKTDDSYDSVFFDDSDDLSGTFYIGVYSIQYSTYSLITTVDRTIPSNFLSKFSTNVTTQQVLSLIEGVPTRGSMNSNFAETVFKFEIKQIAGYEKPIKIQVSPIEGSFRM